MTRGRQALAAAALVVCVAERGATAAPDPTPPAERGLRRLLSKGCSGCHTLDGRPAAGPTFVGLWGKEVAVTAGVTRRVVRADRAYIERSIRQPNAEIVHGYRSRSMPLVPLEPTELEAMIIAIRHIGSEGVQLPWRYYGWLFALIGTALLFVGGHLLLSMHPLRAALVSRLGGGGFQLLYSLAAAGSFVGMIIAWTQTPIIPLWKGGQSARYVPLIGMPIVLVLLVSALLSASPTAAGRERLLTGEFRPTGILKVTRHPGLWAFALFGVLHLPPNGDVAALVLFGSVTLLALLGMVHIDRRRKREHGAAWEQYARKTSLLPFVALARQREGLHLADIGWARIALALLLYGAILLSHRYMIGAPALPG